jgi:hypothetical protein
MYLKRTLLYANVPTNCGKTYSILCLKSLADELNKGDSSTRRGYLFNPETAEGWQVERYMSHRVLFAWVDGNELKADIESLDTIYGQYLETHQREYVFRPYATFFETDVLFVDLQEFYVTTAIPIKYDIFNSISVLWREFISSKSKKILT